MGTLQGEFDRCYTFQTRARDAFALVKSDWEGVVDADATALAAVPRDDWTARLEVLDHGFATAHKPAGLDAGQLVAWNAECEAVAAKAKYTIIRKAEGILAAAGLKAQRVSDALVRLNAAKAAYLAADTLDGGWLVDVLMGVHLGLLAGGASAFAAGADRTLFQAASSFAQTNAEHLLEVIDATSETPSDAAGRQTFLEARARLVEYLGG